MKQPQVAPTDDWQQLQLLAKSPEQRTYEIIRSVVLFGQPTSVRARRAPPRGVASFTRTLDDVV